MKVFMHFMEARSGGLELLHCQELSEQEASSHEKIQLSMIYEISDGKEESDFLVWNIETVEKTDVHEKHVVLVKVVEGTQSQSYH